MATTMTLGGYSFSPVPLLTISKEKVRSGDGTDIQELTRLSFTGTLVASPYLGGASGLDEIDTQMEALRAALKNECQLLLIKCDSTTIIEAYPRIVNYNFEQSNNNWVYTAPYTIDMEFETEVGESTSYTENVRSVNEQWEIEFADETSQFTETLAIGGLDAIPYALRLTHNVSAEAARTCISGSFDQEGWKEARDWVNQRIGYDSGILTSGASGVLNVNPSALGQFNHMRTLSLDEVNGSFAVTESWLLLNTGSSGLAGNALEDFTATIRSSLQEPITSITVEGTIQGLETRDYGSVPGDFSITTEKYSAAETYWNTVSGKLYGRANALAGGISPSLVLSPANTNVSHNKSKGVISYGYEYNNRVCFLLDSGALSGSILSEVITVSDKNPTDVFATIPVLGRAAGPVLQEISTVTEKTRDVSVEILMTPPDSCTILDQIASGDALNAQVDAMLCSLQTDLTDNNDQVFLHVDQKSWVPSQGRYTRQIGWTYQGCSDSGNTSVC